MPAIPTLIGLFFLVLGGIFLGLAIRESSRNRGSATPAQKAWLRIGLIFIAVGVFWLLNACRIVYLAEDEAANRRRYGFACGTLDEHAERGKERFTVERNREDDAVWYDILSFSRPNGMHG